MQKIEAIEKAILNNDIQGLREGIGTLCYVRPDFSTGEFDELVEYVMERGIQLKDSMLVGKLISEGKSTYKEEDFTRAVFELKRNFCDERIEDVKKIGKALYGNKAPKTPVTETAKVSKTSDATPIKCVTNTSRKSSGKNITGWNKNREMEKFKGDKRKEDKSIVSKISKIPEALKQIFTGRN